VTALSGHAPEILWEDGEFVLSRVAWDGEPFPLLAVMPSSSQPSPETLARLQHAYALREELDPAWAARPLRLEPHQGRLTLLSEDPGGEPLSRLTGRPWETGSFLRLAIGIATALAQVHQRGLIHKDIKPTNVLVNSVTGQVWLVGFGIASRLPRERQAPSPPEMIAGTLAYMAPEQTGRMNRSIDFRSDLYALGITLYEMLTGELPFTASDPMEWVHCHIARQPVPPDERVAGISRPLSGIVMKLLAKTAEERYQTAAGLERDLRRCFASWEAQHRIDAFPLGQQDTSDRLLILEKLYGREREIEILLAAFDRVVTTGRTELVLVSGYSGIGKSAVVSELHKALAASRGLFASGKFDQYKRDIPYATLVQAFQGLIRPLLGQSEAELADWRDALSEALGPNGRLIIDVVPELKLLIGDQPLVAELPPQQAQSRLHQMFRRFLGVFAQPEHPLALFLDDLQWLDAGTLDVLADLLIQADVQRLLVIGAYRDNEVDSAHPLMRKLDAVRKEGALVQEISLAPLAREDLGRFIADTLSCRPRRAAALARLVHQKTGGNPFFAIQFISTLAEEGLLRFDHDAARWRWELDRIHARGYTDNVVDLMVGKLTRLPIKTQAALQQLACLGNVAEITMLSIVLGKSEEDIRADLWDAVRLELVEHLEGSYKFIHDRVQEAAYSLIPERLRAETHLRIGRLLAAHTPAEKREEAIFEIVNQLNRSAPLITSLDEREQLAEFNLLAGQRAMVTTAYASALTYLALGEAMLPKNSWESHHELTFALALRRAECEFLTGALAEAEQRLATLSRRAASTVERATVACLRVDLYTTLDQGSRAIAVGLDYLRHLGIDWPPHPTEEEARREYDRIWSQLGSRTIESLIELPLMSDPASLATLDVLSKIGPSAFYTDANLLALVTCRAVNLSLERGNCDASCIAYVLLSMVAGPRFGDYRTAVYRFGQLGYDLVERRGLTRFQARTYMNFGGGVVPWTKHVLAGRDLVRRAFEAASKAGDLTYAAYCGDQLNANLLAAGDPLAEAEHEAERGLAFAQKARFGLVVDAITPQLGLIRTLRGLTLTFGSFDDEQFDESWIERHFSENPDLAFVECWYWIRKLQARFFAGDYASAIEASSRAQRLSWTAASQLETAEYQFYGALSHAASCDSASPDGRQQHVEALAAHHGQLEVWAANCPDNFENRAALVGAEIARIEGRELDAERLYEQAVRSARANGFIHNEALANELAARFYAARGFEKIARVYLQDARYGYVRWGADGKVKQLDEIYPHLREDRPATSGAATIRAPVWQLDVETVAKASQAVSSEIVIESLIKTLMEIAVEHAGAERGVLIVLRGDRFWVEAEATTGRKTVDVNLRQALVAPSELPLSILQYVVRAREPVISDDASSEKPFSADEYVTSRHVRSVLCLPLIKQAKLVGVLYIENNVAASVFTPARIAVLKLLASQAAISLENARLYGELTMSEERWRNLFESVPVGVNMVGLHRRYVAANPAFQRMTGYSEAELHNLTPVDITHEDDRASTEAVMSAQMTGQPYVQHREKRYLRKDGGVIWAEVDAFLAPVAGSAPLLAGVAVDITERKRAEEALRDARADLERMARLTTMGELTASIAHEINQPLAAIVTRSEAALRFLSWDKPDLDEVRDALSGIARDGIRAADVIRGLRALARKSRQQLTKLDVDDVIRQVLALARGEVLRHDVVLQTELAAGDRPIMGDRVQLQQVLLNLIMNGVEAMREVTERTRELTISTALAEPGSVLVAVQDTGAGLDPAVSERMFQPLFTTKPDGLGIGLSICRTIIEAHGGRLWGSPRSPHGAVFRFTVPGIAIATVSPAN
jgi:PAS domain S-box-containing protein